MLGKPSIPTNVPENEPRHTKTTRRGLEAVAMERIVLCHHDIKPANIHVIGQPGGYQQIGNFGLHVPLDFATKASHGGSLWQLPFDVEYRSRNNTLDMEVMHEVRKKDIYRTSKRVG